MKFTIAATIVLSSILALSHGKPFPSPDTEVAQNKKVTLPAFPNKPDFAIGEEVPVSFSVYAPKVVQGTDGSVDLVLKNTGKAEGGSSIVSDVTYNTGTACATVSLPREDYGGVAMTFYTLGRNSASWNKGNDEQDFEMMGSSGKYITNAFVDGASNDNYVEYPRTETKYEFCITYDGETAKYYENGVELTKSERKLTFDEPQYTWFSIWFVSFLVKRYIPFLKY
ncbi:hypothetical protein BKA69DRAFT_1091737 [Paraphysoderma sedebokerense]|nr:hypothetical protein BKA69DRAFT_1091737 [Paraphysoderma sedebokerense]